MPIEKVSGGWRWGQHGSTYASREGAEKQAAAAHAHGYTGDDVGAAGIAIRSPAGRLLFLKRSPSSDHPGEWCFPGGHRESGEDPLATAIREVLEETGHNVKQPAPVDLRNGFTTFAEEVEEEFTPTLNAEHTAFAWANPWDAPEPLHPGVKETLAIIPRTRTADADMLDFAGYYAPEKIGKTRRVTPEGFLILEGTPIARTGTQMYAAHEVNGDLAHDDPDYIRPDGAGQIIVERVPDEVFHPDTLASFEGKDYVIEHPPEGVDVSNWKNQSVGHVQNVRRGEGVEDDLVIADIVVKDPIAIAYVNKHLPENSAGYRADYEQAEPGRAVQRNIIGNHVAAVMAGRAGARVAVRDHATTHTGDDDMAQKKPFMPALRAALAAIGVKTEDATKVENVISAIPTNDAKEDEEEGEGKSDLKELAKDMKGIKDWMKARDAEREEEGRKKKETEDQKARDAEETSKKAREATEVAAHHEAVGDTVLEAEGPGTTVNLGKTWTGSMTGDSANEPILGAVNARAEILAPGTPKLTVDAIKGNQGKVLAAFMRSALTQHATTAAGKQNVRTFLVNDSIENLKGSMLVGVFNGVSQLVRARNNQSSAASLSRATSDGGRAGPMTAAQMNEANRKHWAAK
jgi:8-oxo-dGTP pyrophosphatase MutT (NUDIX family)